MGEEQAWEKGKKGQEEIAECKQDVSSFVWLSPASSPQPDLLP